ncbi:MAG: NADH-quinone oxidoreductase subunit L [Chlorobi bacterium]|nr:NADH-quinone oxidoreductase subunit L [Chlorobiota bacterium]
MHEYAFLIILFPLLGFLFNGLLGRFIKSEKLVGAIGSAAVGLSFLVGAGIFIELLGYDPEARSFMVPIFDWISTGSFHVQIAYQVDPLSLLMVLIVTGVGFLIHVYSIGYMHGDRGFWRFFTYLNLFIFAMLNLVLADNFLLMFLGWEGVGLCSYLLIGFWYDKKFPGVSITWTGDAGNKAFIVNRIGDFGFMLAMFLIFKEFGSLHFNTVFDAAQNYTPGYEPIFWITLLLFVGATGKSAQIPLFVWLPDAMAGPTPVSALIHAATMVTAGVYMVARCSVLFALSPDTMIIIAVIGALTAIVAASIGLVQNDIKKVLAYSTVSQLGYMFMAMGVGAFAVGIFHVMTHAFFKACLFLGSGSVIHAMHEEQDIRHMGGLKRVMPITYWTFLISSFAIAGFPPLSGFFSKDEILWRSFADGSLLLWLIGATAALFTAFYMFRMVSLTFEGKPRWGPDKHPHESPSTMTIPLIILAGLAAVGGFVGMPAFITEHNPFESWLAPVLDPAARILALPAHHETGLEIGLMLISVVVAIVGWYMGRTIYTRRFDIADRFVQSYRWLYSLLLNKYYVDEAYHTAIVDPVVKGSEKFLWLTFDVGVIDGIVNGSAKMTRALADVLKRIQTGVVQNYAAIIFFGILCILGLLFLG